MPSLETFIVDTVQDMLVQRYAELDLDPEMSAVVLCQACEYHKMTLRLASSKPEPSGPLTDALAGSVAQVEYGCFSRTTADEESLLAATERAIMMLFLLLHREMHQWEITAENN